MAKNWDKLKDKMAQDFGGPRPDDWQKMAHQLDAHPRFRQKKALGWRGAGLVLVLAATVLIWWLSELPDSGPSEPSSVDQRALPKAKTYDEEAIPRGSTTAPAAKQAQPPQQKTPDHKPALSASEQSGQKASQAKISRDRQTSNPKEQNAATVSEASASKGKEMPTQSEPALLRPVAEALSQLNERLAPRALSLRAEKPYQSKGWQALFPWEEPILSPPLAASSLSTKDFRPATAGFRLSALSLSGDGMLFFGPRPKSAEPNYYASAAGLALHWRRQNWGLHLGLNYRRQWAQASAEKRYVLDSSFLSVLYTQEVLELRPVWVIDSLYHGRWVNDSLWRSRTDTAGLYLRDSSALSPRAGALEHYFELPLYGSYRWHRNRWWLELGGGLIISHWNRVDQENSTSQLGLHLMIQPQLGYRFHPRWSAMTGLHSRYALRPSGGQVPAWAGALRMGVYYHF